MHLIRGFTSFFQVGFSFCHVLEAFGCSTPQFHLYHLSHQGDILHWSYIILYLVSPAALDSEVMGVACVILDLPLLLSEAISVTAVRSAYVLIMLTPTD